MGKKDLTGKQLEEYADVFVDIYNHLLFEKEYLQEKGFLDHVIELEASTATVAEACVLSVLVI